MEENEQNQTGPDRPIPFTVGHGCAINLTLAAGIIATIILFQRTSSLETRVDYLEATRTQKVIEKPIEQYPLDKSATSKPTTQPSDYAPLKLKHEELGG